MVFLTEVDHSFGFECSNIVCNNLLWTAKPKQDIGF